MNDQINSEVPEEIHPEKLYRPEVIEIFVKAGIELFCRDRGEDTGFKSYIKETNVSGWVFFEAQENKIRLGRAEFDEIVRKVYAAFTGVLENSHDFLTVGKLRKSLEALPDNAPVFYQRIEDIYFEKYNWKTQKFVWESRFAKADDIEFVKDQPSEHYDIKQKDGKTLLRNFSPYIAAHSAYEVVNDDGKMAFVLNAHY